MQQSSGKKVSGHPGLFELLPGASAVARTGLSVKLCDIDSGALDFDLAKLKSTISEQPGREFPVPIMGWSADMREIQNYRPGKGAYVVEDAAQAAGARVENP